MGDVFRERTTHLGLITSRVDEFIINRACPLEINRSDLGMKSLSVLIFANCVSMRIIYLFPCIHVTSYVVWNYFQIMIKPLSIVSYENAAAISL